MPENTTGQSAAAAKAANAKEKAEKKAAQAKENAEQKAANKAAAKAEKEEIKRRLAEARANLKAFKEKHKELIKKNKETSKKMEGHSAANITNIVDAVEELSKLCEDIFERIKAFRAVNKARRAFDQGNGHEVGPPAVGAPTGPEPDAEADALEKEAEALNADVEKVKEDAINAEPEINGDPLTAGVNGGNDELPGLAEVKKADKKKGPTKPTPEKLSKENEERLKKEKEEAEKAAKKETKSKPRP